MKHLAPALLALVIISCGQPAHQQQAGSSAITNDTPATTATIPLPEKIIAERAASGAVALDTANGTPLLALQSNALLNAGMPVNGWLPLVFETDISEAEYKARKLRKGRIITSRGDTAGKLLQDVVLEATGEGAGGQKNGMFHAYLRQQDVHPFSVIETALAAYLQQHPGRSLDDMQPFIAQFQLEASGNNQPFLEYTNYESTADDPSPAYRTVLVFHNNRLIGVADARPLTLPATTAIALDRDYHACFFNDTDKKLQQEYVKKFNRFINSVD